MWLGTSIGKPEYRTVASLQSVLLGSATLERFPLPIGSIRLLTDVVNVLLVCAMLYC